MAEYGQKTVRSAHPLNIFKKPEPKPLWVVEGASSRGGRRILASHALSPDGQWEGGSEDKGDLRGEKDPMFYMHFLGGEVSMTKSDMHEMIEGMKDKRKAVERRPLPDLKRMREQIREAQKYIEEQRRGVKRFAV